MSIEIRITSDGHVNTYDSHGTKIDELSGDLTLLHSLVKINRMSSDKKSKLPKELRVRSARFYFVREDIGDLIDIPTEHVIKFIRYIEGAKDVDSFIQELIINKLNS